ncbi:MAG: 3,4-dihydroxy-2-butanone-4-phosphate synthase [Alphaproteobacteria bacterium]
MRQFRNYLSSIEEVVEEARNGRMFILVDDEDRENEGDLIIPAQMATPDAINFMARFGRGLICLAMPGQRVEELGLPLMAGRNETRHATAFTVSIEAREGVTTGISAADRARTIAVAIDPSKGRKDIIIPGHVFPLVARDGGVLVRAGHTEAAVDIARLAGLNPSGVICEIMNEDGSMARMPDLVKFAQFHNLKIGTIADLIAYRRRNDRIVERIIETTFESRFGGAFRMYIYVNRAAYAEHLALVKGDIRVGGPALVRMHRLSVFHDVLGDKKGTRIDELHKSMELIEREGRGAIVLIREPWANSVSQLLRDRETNPGNAPPTGEQHDPALRDYGVGAQILLDLGVRDLILLTNSHRAIVGLEGYGLTVVDRRPLPVDERK